MCAKRKGGFLVDVLLAMMILLLGIIPLIASVSFAYQTLTDSVVKTNHLNEVYDEVDSAILDCSLNGGFPSGFATHAAAPAGISNPQGGFVPLTTSPHLHYKSYPIGRGEIRIYVVNTL